MNQVAVFVDAGYLYAGGSTSISGSAKRRTELTLDIPSVVQYLAVRATALSGTRLLRIYWYDGALSSRLATDHQLLASSDNVKLRLGIINGFGEQKGVDAKVITDLADLARNGALSDAVLVGGDEDLRIGVELAQERGVRVHLLTIEGSSSSPTLRQEADTVAMIARADISSFLTIAAHPIPAVQTLTNAAVPVQSPSQVPLRASANPPVPIQAANALQEQVTGYLASLNEAERIALKSAIEASNNSIPTEHDGRLLAGARTILGRSLEWSEKTALRKELRSQLGVE